MNYPKEILHWIDGQETATQSGQTFSKINPATGESLALVVSGDKNDVERAILLASQAFVNWSSTPHVQRAEILRRAANLIEENQNELAEIVALESGKPLKHAQGEVAAAVKCGLFIADQSQEFDDQPLFSALPNREAKLVRKSIGVGALIVPFNNPAASVAWKIFPALLCGNSVVIKSHRDTPYVAVYLAKIFEQAGVPKGVISVLQGSGQNIGQPLIEDKRVQFISFTGSVGTGQAIIKASANRLAKVSIEAGGKNPLVICDDCDFDLAVETALNSAFVDGGQRCAAGSRIIVFDSIYDEFKERFLSGVKNLKIGINENDNFGAIINQKRLEEILETVDHAVKAGATLLAGGKRFTDDERKTGFFLEPTVLENVASTDEISCEEIFGPVVIIYRVKDFDEALKLANDSPFGLTGSIHTKDMDRAQAFIGGYEGGVVRVNGPTHGSEPHMPFGGIKLSGNGWREPGVKAFDFYAEWQQITIDAK